MNKPKHFLEIFFYKNIFSIIKNSNTLTFKIFRIMPYISFSGNKLKTTLSNTKVVKTTKSNYLMEKIICKFIVNSRNYITIILNFTFDILNRRYPTFEAFT